jgi:hypothetical protein
MAHINFSEAMLGDTPTMLKFAKWVLDGEPTVFKKHDFVAAINKRAADLYKNAPLSAAQKFDRTITSDPAGQLLFQALKAAGGSEIVPPPAADEADDKVPRGPAYAEMECLAADYQLANPYKTPEQCFSQVYTAAANRKLRERVVAESIAAARAAAAG